MNDMGRIFGGLSGKSKKDFTGGNSRYITYRNVYNHITVKLDAEDYVKISPEERQTTLHRGDVLFTGSSETPDEVGLSSVITMEPEENIYLNSFCIGFRPTDSQLINPEYAKHLFRSRTMREQIERTASGVTRFNVSKKRLGRIQVPVPSQERQKAIASVLDKFDSLVNDLSSGLPAEIEARRKQYEHYCDRLLTFRERGSAWARLGR